MLTQDLTKILRLISDLNFEQSTEILSNLKNMHIECGRKGKLKDNRHINYLEMTLDPCSRLNIDHPGLISFYLNFSHNFCSYQYIYIYNIYNEPSNTLASQLLIFSDEG